MFGRPSAPSKKDDDYGMPQLRQGGGNGLGHQRAQLMAAPVYQKQTAGLFSTDPYGKASPGASSHYDVSSGLAIFGRGQAPASALASSSGGIPSGIPVAGGGRSAAVAPLGDANVEPAYGRSAVGAPVVVQPHQDHQRGQSVFNFTLPPASTPPPPSITIQAPEPARRGKEDDDDGGGRDRHEPAATCLVSALRMTSCVWVPLVVLLIVVMMLPDNAEPPTNHADFIRDPSDIAKGALGDGGGGGGEGGGLDVVAPDVPIAPLYDGSNNASLASIQGSDEWNGTGDPSAIEAQLDPALLREKLRGRLRAEVEAEGDAGTATSPSTAKKKPAVMLRARLESAKDALEKLREGGESLEHEIVSKGLKRAVAAAIGGGGGGAEDGEVSVDIDVDLRKAPPAPGSPLPPPPQPPAPFNSFNTMCLRNIKRAQVPFFERFYCRFNTFLKVSNPLKGGEMISLEELLVVTYLEAFATKDMEHLERKGGDKLSRRKVQNDQMRQATKEMHAMDWGAYEPPRPPPPWRVRAPSPPPPDAIELLREEQEAAREAAKAEAAREAAAAKARAKKAKRGMMRRSRALLRADDDASTRGGGRALLRKKAAATAAARPANPEQAGQAAAAQLHQRHEHDRARHEAQANQMDLLYNLPPSPPPPPPGHFQYAPDTRRKQHEFQTYFSVTAIGAKSKDFAYAAADTMAALGVHGVSRVWIGDVEQFNAVADERRRRSGPGNVDVVNAHVSDAADAPVKKRVLGHVVTGQDIDAPHPRKNPGGPERDIGELVIGARQALLPDHIHAPAEEPLMLHMEAKYASLVLPALAPELRVGRPRAILFTVTRFEFGVAFSQEYPYHVYAIGKGLHAESSRPALMLVDHETYTPELDEIFPDGETITMLAVFKNDHFNELVRDYGLLACDCHARCQAPPIKAPLTVTKTEVVGERLTESPRLKFDGDPERGGGYLGQRVAAEAAAAVGDPLYDVNGGGVDAGAEGEAASAAVRRAKEQLRAAEEAEMLARDTRGRTLLAGKKGGAAVSRGRVVQDDPEETWSCPEVHRKSENRVSWFGFKSNTARVQNMNMIVDDVSEAEQLSRHERAVQAERNKGAIG